MADSKIGAWHVFKVGQSGVRQDVGLLSRSEGSHFITAVCERHVQANGCVPSENQIYRPVISAFVPTGQAHGMSNESKADNDLIVETHFDRLNKENKESNKCRTESLVTFLGDTNRVRRNNCDSRNEDGYFIALKVDISVEVCKSAICP